MPADATGSMTIDAIKAAIPHREPMLLIDEVVERSADHIVSRREIREGEFFLQGHYPDNPIVPGVILCEACMQSGAVLMSETSEQDGVPVAVRLNNVKFRQMVRPRDTIEMHVHVTERSAPAIFMAAKVLLNDRVAMRCEFACMMTDKES